MKRRIGAWVVCVLLGILAGATTWYFTRGPRDLEPLLIYLGLIENPNAPLTATGTLEAVEVTVSAEVGGRVARLHVSEGERVAAGALLLDLDDSLLRARLAEAEAGVKVAQAALARAEVGARPEQVQRAEAMLAQAIAARDGAYQALLDAQAVRQNPQELDDQIDQARTQVEVAQHLVMQAVAIKDAVELVRDNARVMLDWLGKGMVIPVPLPGGDVRYIYLGDVDTAYARTQLDYQWWYAWTLVNTAGAGRDGAQKVLDELLRVRQHPHEIDAQVAEAQGRYEAALAMVAAAQAQLDALRAGATEEQLQALRARVEEARAARALVETQLARTRVRAPIGGTVVELPLSVGETARPGVRLAVIADLDVIDLTVYVPEDRLGEVYVGQSVLVRVDALPGRTFTGRVRHIATEAEYTSQEVQSKVERVNMVFAVRIELDNPQHLLKPGMPADVEFVAGGRDER